VAHALARANGARTVAITAVPGAPVAEAAGDVVLLDFADEASVVQTRFATTALTLLRAHEGVDVAPAIEDAERALELALPVEPGAVDRWAFLGRGWTVGLAHEAALKLRESAQAWTEAYPVFEYRHGPISIAGPGAVVWFLGAPADGLGERVLEAGGTVVAPDLDPLASLVLAQRTAVALAEAAGLDPDNPRNLTRSVVLTSSEVTP
jgi:fructoselysine-6-P-deglycase FrlB-like protein